MDSTVSSTTYPSAQERADIRLGFVLVVLATIAWSLSSPFIDALLSRNHMTALQVSFWRGAIAAVVVGIFMLVARRDAFRVEPRDLPFFAVYGLVGLGLLQLTWAASVQVNKAAVATVLVYIAPALIAAGEWLLYRRRTTPMQMGAIAVNLVGCALVARVYDFHAFDQHPLGALLGLATGLNFTAYTLLSKGAPPLRRTSNLTVLFYFLLFGTLGLAVAGGIGEGANLVVIHLPLSGWLVLLGLGLGPTVFGYSLYNASLRYLPATVASLVNTTEPVMSAVWALVFLGRVMILLQWAGTIMIVGAVTVMQTVGARAGRKQEVVPIVGGPIEELDVEDDPTPR